jgi:hypothetical protein
MRKFLVFVLSLALALSLALTMGCKKSEEKAGEMKEKAAEKAGELKETAAEKAAELKETAAEKAGEMKEKAAEKASELKETAAEKAGEMKEKTAGWDSCKGCHTDSGKPALSKADLLKKFKTEKEFIAAAKKSKNPMMNNFKKDDLLKPAAKDLGLK